jgi:hypothetical protein
MENLTLRAEESCCPHSDILLSSPTQLLNSCPDDPVSARGKLLGSRSSSENRLCFHMETCQTAIQELRILSMQYAGHNGAALALARFCKLSIKCIALTLEIFRRYRDLACAIFPIVSSVVMFVWLQESWLGITA